MNHGKEVLKTNQNSAALRILIMVVVFCIPLSLALVLHGSIFGYEPGKEKEDKGGVQAISRQGNSMVINTTSLGHDISGYAGAVPLEIFVTDGVIDSVRALPNSETPGFFAKLEKGGLSHAWDGKTLSEASDMNVDAISGATYSSNAYIANVKAGVAYAEGMKASTHDFGFSLVGLAAILVILAGAILPFFIHKPTYRLAQQLLNVAVLGFWAGTFIDYAMMIGFFVSSPHFSLAFIISLILMIVAFIYPAIGKPGHYCAWICPFGSLQDLSGRICSKKWKMSPRLIKGLDTFRQVLWCVLLLLLYTGLAVEWIDYEVFSAFIVTSASWIVICVGVLFIVLSLFISRPFCRFVCPTGTLLKDA